MTIYSDIIATRKNIEKQSMLTNELSIANPMWYLFILSLNEGEEQDALDYWAYLIGENGVNIDTDSVERDYTFSELETLYGY